MPAWWGAPAIPSSAQRSILRLHPAISPGAFNGQPDVFGSVALRVGRTPLDSRWHKVDSAELWHWYGGAPLLLEVKQGETRHEYRLGPDLHEGDYPHAAVPAHAWQSAPSLGAWTLLGCTVAPGFDFSGFELAPEGFQP